MYALIQHTVHNYIYFTAVIDLKLFYLVPNDCPPPPSGAEMCYAEYASVGSVEVWRTNTADAKITRTNTADAKITRTNTADAEITRTGRSVLSVIVASIPQCTLWYSSKEC